MVEVVVGVATLFPARAVRRVRVLLGLVPLAEMTAAEVLAVLRDRVDAAG